MINQKYQISLHTPLGTRKGTLTMSISGQHIDGILYILNEQSTFSGIVLPDGTCQISGNLKTLVSTIPFQGKGRKNEKNLRFDILTDKYAMILDGGIDNESS